MSSVVIAGDTSGSVTLQAPAVAGTTVLTLPATSGTVITGPGGVVAISGGGTGQTTATAAFNALNPMTTTGDIIYESSPTVAARLPVGTTGQVLTVAGGLPSWAAAAAGGFSNMTVYTSPGTFTTPASTTRIKVTVTGGGGNNGINPGNTYNGGGGGGGGTATYVGPVTASTGYAVTVGGATGTSSFGALASATGGANGTANIGANYGNGGAGGSGSAGTFLLTGGSGGGDIGLGGTSFFSNAVTRTSPGAGANGQLYGGGATAGSYGPTAATQFSGGAGVVIVEF
jgi:hypothetical protein